MSTPARLAGLTDDLRVLGGVATHGDGDDEVGQGAQLRRDAFHVDHVRLRQTRVAGGGWWVAGGNRFRGGGGVATRFFCGDEDRLCAAPAVEVAPTVAQGGSGGY